MSFVEQLKAARKASTPIVAISTPDPAATEQMCCASIGGEDDVPKVSWDIVRGYVALNAAGEIALNNVGECDGDPTGALSEAVNMPARTLLFFHNAQRFINDVTVMQAAWNLRDRFKSDHRTLVLLGPSFRMPEELQTDVVEFDEPLPDCEQLHDIARKQLESVADQVEFKVTDSMIQSLAERLKGCSAFAAEQLTAMAIRKTHLDVNSLDVQAKKLIEQTPGLTFERGREDFNDIGGLEFAKTFGMRLFSGPCRPAVVVRVEELEKAMAGSTGGDLSGTSSDALQVLLSSMEDNNWTGMLAAGPAGSGKSLYAKSLANSNKAKAIRFDVNACKGSLVGESEQKIRQAMKVIKTLGGDRVFFIASVNRLETLPPELQRRFRCGVWFFDIPTAEEAEQIWAINKSKFQIFDEDSPSEPDLTGADIRNICEMAHALKCSLTEAMHYVVPLKTQSPQSIDDARKAASGRFISAAQGGTYKLQRNAVRRKVAVN